MVANLILIILLQTLTSNYRHERGMERCCLEPVCLRACQAAERPIFCGSREAHPRRTNECLPSAFEALPALFSSTRGPDHGAFGLPGTAAVW